MEKIVQSSEIAALTRHLSDLEIIVSNSGDGYTVFTTTEPLFCFERKNLSEINSIVEDTIRSYIETFFKVGKFTLTVESEEFSIISIPEQRLTPISKIKPSVKELVGVAA